MRGEKSRALLAPMQKVFQGIIPRFDFHMHTDWTDGKDSMFDMHIAACKKKLCAVLFSEHVRKSSEEWFLRFAEEVRSLPSDQCQAFVGMETRVCDFLGTLDCTQTMIDLSDLVIGSVHRFPDKQTGETLGFDEVPVSEALEIEYELLLAILENPDVDILGHPFGMSIKKFNLQPSTDQMLSLIRKAAKNNVAIEVNTAYHANFWQIVDWCRGNDAMISLGSDAHSIQEVGSIVHILSRGRENETD